MVKLSSDFQKSWLDAPAVYVSKIDNKEKKYFEKNDKLNTFGQSIKSRVYQIAKTAFDLSIKPIAKVLEATKNLGVGVVKLGVGIPVGIVSPKSNMAKNGIKSISTAFDTLISCVAGIGKAILFNPIDIIAPELQVGTRIDNQFAKVSKWRLDSQKEECVVQTSAQKTNTEQQTFTSLSFGQDGRDYLNYLGALSRP